MKCKFKVQDRDDGSCNKKAVSKYSIDGESNYCRLHHYIHLSISYAKRISELEEQLSNTPQNAKPEPLAGVFSFDITAKNPPAVLDLKRFTGKKETWHLSGTAPANELMLISVNGSTVFETKTPTNGKWTFDLCDWHIPASATNGKIRILFPELHTPEGDTYVINFTTNKIGKVAKSEPCKHKPVRIRGFEGIQSVICEQCGKWLKDVSNPGDDPQF